MRTLEDRVDEGRDGGAFGQHHQTAEYDHHDNDRHEPEFLAHFHIRPQLTEQGHRSELVIERARRRARRPAWDPVALYFRVVAQVQRPLTGEPHQPAYRRANGVEPEAE